MLLKERKKKKERKKEKAKNVFTNVSEFRCKRVKINKYVQVEKTSNVIVFLEKM